MSLPVRLRASAEQDVAAHAEFIQGRNLDAALRFLDAVDATFALLGAMPEIGGLCRFTKPHYAGLRVFAIPLFPNYLIFYRLIENEVEIIRILHGARDLQVIFGDEQDLE